MPRRSKLELEAALPEIPQAVDGGVKNHRFGVHLASVHTFLEISQGTRLDHPLAVPKKQQTAVQSVQTVFIAKGLEAAHAAVDRTPGDSALQAARQKDETIRHDRVRPFHRLAMGHPLRQEPVQSRPDQFFVRLRQGPGKTVDPNLGVIGKVGEFRNVHPWTASNGRAPQKAPRRRQTSIILNWSADWRPRGMSGVPATMIRRLETNQMKAKRVETKVVHSGDPTPRIEGAVNLPVFQSSTFEYAGEARYQDLRYIRLNNTPNHRALHAKLADLESGEAALVTASGMAAIATTLLATVRSGDHLLAQKGLYGGTHHFLVEDLSALGISCDVIDAEAPETWAAKLRPNTRAILVETISNPLMGLADLEAVVAFARQHQLVSMIDNTFASPINFRPLEHGFDLVLHSATKYLNGHTDIVAGAVVGSADRIDRITRKLNHLGGSLDPHACFLLHRGIKTLALRVQHQNRSALQIARFLAAQPAVASVNYPGLETHPGYNRAKRLLGGFGGMLSFELQGGVEATGTFLAGLEIPIVAPSLGGVESLVSQPAKTSHVGIPRPERLALGITDTLVRLSVGIEATEDLVEDLEQALAKVEHTLGSRI